jgi:hypothetical protein
MFPFGGVDPAQRDPEGCFFRAAARFVLKRFGLQHRRTICIWRLDSLTGKSRRVSTLALSSLLRKNISVFPKLIRV